ncbi:reverse transcriptase domain-containing protein [Tanacetum coccineum]|uniref:Reverse transcriptase domain-containing protein n=1 Tax=Tanacetum coccineum TaxID=301880 RepID=A0ABQ5F319_9ASTR
MQEGMFLGYKVNAEGLKVCPDKADAVLSLPSSGCLKDVQKLNEKLASLNKFLSKSAKKSLPFFKTLKKCTKKSNFQWTQEAEVAFKQMKKLIAELPMLTAPKEKEELIMYLAAANEAISAVLMIERGGKQLPVYFVSRALRGPRSTTPHGKIGISLAQCKQTAKKLEGYDIQYRPRISIKGQILADFIIERPDEESPNELIAEQEKLPEPWTLFIDGSSCIDRSGAGLILTNPEGVEFTYAMSKDSVWLLLEKVKTLASKLPRNPPSKQVPCRARTRRGCPKARLHLKLRTTSEKQIESEEEVNMALEMITLSKKILAELNLKIKIDWIEKVLSVVNTTTNNKWFFSCGVFRLAFDLRKSIHYKVVLAERPSGDTWIHIYSSETGNWSFCRDRFSYFSFDHFESAIYWNDAFHWLEGLNRELKHCRLNIEDNDHPIMTTLDIPHGLHRGRNFLESFGGHSNDLMLLLMEIPYMLHLEGKFFESCGCLLLVCRDDIGSNDFTIYEIMKGSSVWSIRYLVNIEQLMHPLPEGWSIRTSVWSICLGEGEEDAFVVINISGKVVKYHLISKTTTEIFDIGSNQMDDDDDDAVEFIPPFEVDPNIYEFIPSLACV